MILSYEEYKLQYNFSRNKNLEKVIYTQSQFSPCLRCNLQLDNLVTLNPVNYQIQIQIRDKIIGRFTYRYFV